MSQPFIAILMGSENDLNTMTHCTDTLSLFNIPHEVRVLSAHRTPELTAQYVKDAQTRGAQVFIAAAGMAAHLAGAVAAHSTRPVIGVPLAASDLNGVDSLLSTAQMPGGMPVACMCIGKAGAINAGHLAAQILAIHDPELHTAILTQRDKKRQSIMAANQKLQDALKDTQRESIE